MYLHLFPPEILALQQEVFFHPPLLLQLRKAEVSDYNSTIAEIAAYCNVVLDGAYTYDDLIKLSDLLTKKLQQLRAIYVPSN